MGKLTLHEKITNQIIDAMDNAPDFRMPWNNEQSLPTNAFTNNHYQGINTISLWSRSMRQGYDSPTWATYNQWKQLGAQVQKGERGSTIVIYKPLLDSDGEPIYLSEPPYKPRALISAATVFNANQVSGFEDTNSTTEPLVDKTQNLIKVDSFIKSTKASISHKGTKAYYDYHADSITIPDRNRFYSTTSSSATESYYSTLLHELIHWTGNHNRCNRDLIGRFGQSAYAKEELVAELGSAFLCSELGISKSPRLDHVSYIKSWLQVLKEDDKAIFLASSKATDAINYLNHLQRKAKTETKNFIPN